MIITLGFLALFHWLGFPVQIDLQVIGAIMTIIGYSLNDTIIVFDRITGRYTSVAQNDIQRCR